MNAHAFLLCGLLAAASCELPANVGEETPAPSADKGSVRRGAFEGSPLASAECRKQCQEVQAVCQGSCSSDSGCECRCRNGFQVCMIACGSTPPPIEICQP
jgi:hypothetical protein